MIVFDLKCTQDHVFEAWFGSSAAFEEQRADGLVCCPICGDCATAKAVMAPNIPAKGNRRAPLPPPPPPNVPDPQALKAAMRALATAQGKMLENSQWVGRAFADRARAMHVGEEDAAPIHGQSTPAEAQALAEEGVPIAPLPFPVLPPESIN